MVTAVQHPGARAGMTRKDFQQLARVRLKEAKALLNLEHFACAYYLAGYVIECALKACIAKSLSHKGWLGAWYGSREPNRTPAA